MSAIVSRWFSGITSTFMPKQVTPPLTERQQRVAAQAPVIASTAHAANQPAQKHTGQSLSDKGWFAPITGFFRDQFYSCIKGKESQHSQAVRVAYQGVGGEERTLPTAENFDVRTVTFKADSFQRKVKEAGGKFVDLVHLSGDRFPAVELERELPKPFYSYLQQMGILDSEHGDGQWRTISSNGKNYLVSAADYSKLITGKYTDLNTGRLQDITVKERGVKDTCTQSTVILSGPIYSHFESYNTAREVGAFLIRGLNVLIFEDKHPTVWDSESVTNTAAARDAIYGHVIAQPGMKASSVIWKGTCFGAIPNVVAAARYPGSAVIADQTFVRFSDIASQYAGQTSWGKWIPQFLRTPFISAAASANDCAHTLEKDLSKIKGPVCLIENDRDELIPKEMREELRKLLPANGMKEVVHINNKEVDHAEGWYKDAHASQKIDLFLKKIGATSGTDLSQAAASSQRTAATAA